MVAISRHVLENFLNASDRNLRETQRKAAEIEERIRHKEQRLSEVKHERKTKRRLSNEQHEASVAKMKTQLEGTLGQIQEYEQELSDFRAVQNFLSTCQTRRDAFLAEARTLKNLQKEIAKERGLLEKLAAGLEHSDMQNANQNEDLAATNGSAESATKQGPTGKPSPFFFYGEEEEGTDSQPQDEQPPEQDWHSKLQQEQDKLHRLLLAVEDSDRRMRELDAATLTGEVQKRLARLGRKQTEAGRTEHGTSQIEDCRLGSRNTLHLSDFSGEEKEMAMYAAEDTEEEAEGHSRHFNAVLNTEQEADGKARLLLKSGKKRKTTDTHLSDCAGSPERETELDAVGDTEEEAESQTHPLEKKKTNRKNNRRKNKGADDSDATSGQQKTRGESTGETRASPTTGEESGNSAGAKGSRTTAGGVSNRNSATEDSSALTAHSSAGSPARRRGRGPLDKTGGPR